MSDVTHTHQRDPQTYSIIGAAMEVHSQLGHGVLEAVYQDAMMVELAARRIPFLREVNLPIVYRGQRLSSSYRADFVCYDRIIVETKALSAVGPNELAQVINYLKASDCTLGLLINFGTPRLTYKRCVLSPPTDSCVSSAPSAYSPSAKGSP